MRRAVSGSLIGLNRAGPASETDHPVTQEHFVLIVSDRPEQARILARGMMRVLPARLVGPSSALPAEMPLVALVDLGKDGDVLRWLRQLHDLRVACLHLDRHPPADPNAAQHPVGATRTLAADAARPTILKALFDLVDVVQQDRKSVV